MLLKYGIRNFLSFKEGSEVSLKLDKNVPLAISGGKDYSTVLCIKGANGSGKTHLLKGLAFIANFASKSFDANPESEIPVDPFFDSAEPSDFFAEFMIDDISYRYELSVTKNRVIREALFQTINRKTKLFERTSESVRLPKKLAIIGTIKLRSNASIISTAHQHGVSELEPVYEFFSKIMFNVTQAGLRNTVNPSALDNISRFLSEHPDYLEKIIDFIKECDIGISDIAITSEESQEGKRNYFPVFHHDVGRKTMKVFPSTESHGTICLFRFLAGYITAIKTGGIFIADEFDAFLHPNMLPKVLAIFTNQAINSTGAQLIFSAHDSEILNICGKYRTYLVNKEHNESYAYRLDEIPGDILRNDRPIAGTYREGRIGGVPRI